MHHTDFKKKTQQNKTTKKNQIIFALKTEIEVKIELERISNSVI